MAQYIVRHAYFVDAPSEEAAVELARQQAKPTFVRVHTPRPVERLYGPMKWYVQPQPILDNAWDAFHERDFSDPPFENEPDPFPKFIDLALRGLEPPQLSMVMDVAITSYRERWPT